MFVRIVCVVLPCFWILNYVLMLVHVLWLYAFQPLTFNGWVVIVVLFLDVVACISFGVVIRVEICTCHKPKISKITTSNVHMIHIWRVWRALYGCLMCANLDIGCYCCLLLPMSWECAYFIICMMLNAVRFKELFSKKCPK